jgi:hypothetical protein
MVGDCYVVRITTKARLQSNVATYLPGDFVPIPPEQPDEVVTGKITR